MGELLADLMGRWSLWAGPWLNEVGVEFISPRYFYEFFLWETPKELLVEMPDLGWFHGVVGFVYLTVILYLLYRFRYVERLRQGWAESRQQREAVRAARAERRKKLEAAETEAAGVSYEAFQALREGNRAFDEGRYAEASVAYREAARASPPLSAAWVGRGAALGRLGRHEEAREAFGRALTLNPANAEALANLGVTALATGETESARSAFARAVAVDEACARGHYGLAVLAAADGAKADLLTHLKQALRLDSALLEVAASEPAFASLADDACVSALLDRFSPSETEVRRAG